MPKYFKDRMFPDIISWRSAW